MACKMPKLITSARGPIALWLGVGAAEPPTVAELQLQLKHPTPWAARLVESGRLKRQTKGRKAMAVDLG